MATLVLGMWLWPLVVLVHELGHYASARWFGITVLRVFVFQEVGRLRLFSLRFGDTLFGVGIVPTSGYTLLDGLEPSALGFVRPGMFHLAPKWQRAMIILAGPLANLIAALTVWLCRAWLSVEVVDTVLLLNLFLAASTLVPLPGTDGNHLWRLYKGGEISHL